jgi:peptidyl-prolyl cis-trans isomerase D
MRENIQPKRIVSYLFILVIALVFTVQFGPGSKGCEAKLDGSAVAPAVVNGKSVSARDLSRAYAAQLSAVRAQGIPETLAKQAVSVEAVVEQLVSLELLAQAAEQRGIIASDKEIREALQKSPDFEKDGKFDVDRYKTILRNYYRQTPSDFERDLRRRMSAGKLLELVQASAVVSEDEVKSKYLREGDTANITFARFLPTMFASKVKTPTAKELTAFQQDHAKAISDHYDEHRIEYHQPERVRARQIVLRTDPGMTEEKKAEVKKRALNLKAEIEGGKAFADVAMQFSEDVSTKARGGDLGLLERRSLSPTLGEALFSLAVDEVSQPVEESDGIFLLKVEEKLPPQRKELAEVQGEIAQQIFSKEKAKELARAEAEKALAQVKAGKKLAVLFPPEKEGSPAVTRYETETRPEAVVTGAFNSGSENIPHLGAVPELVSQIFKTERPKLLDQVYPAGDGYTVVEVTDRQQANEKAFSEKKESLISDARWAKRTELRDSFIKALRKNAEVVTRKDSLTALAEPDQE